MAKLYKSKYTSEDLAMIMNYVNANGVELLIEVWVDGSDDGDVYPISANVPQGINLTDKYYDSINSRQKCAELLVRDRAGEITCIYHVERNCSGLTYEILEYAKDYSISANSLLRGY